jgi:peptide chain release factor 2
MRSGGIFDFETKSQKLEEVNGLLEDPKVWDNAKKAQELGKEKRTLELVVHNLQNLENGIKDSLELFEMAREEGDDDTLLSIDADTQAIEKKNC